MGMDEPKWQEEKVKKQRTLHNLEINNEKETWWEISEISSVADSWAACIIGNSKDPPIHKCKNWKDPEKKNEKKKYKNFF